MSDDKPGNVIQIAKARKGKAKVIKPREGWEAQLILNDRGNPTRSLANVGTILSEHPDWQGVLAYDAFGETVVSLKPPPVRPQEKPANHAAGEWTDADDIRTAMWLGSVYGIDAGVQTVGQAVLATARKNTVHPVRQYLESLTWDAQQRLPTLFARYFGAESTSYTEAIGKMLMVACVARVMRPGCKVDTVWVLEGPQGIRKSSAAKVLCKNDAWFSDSGITLGDKDSFQALRGIWIYELPELIGIRNARDVERYKAFFSSSTDNYRPSYGKRTGKVPRQCVFISTTNESIYLADKTGNRRFLPVRCGTIDLEALTADVDQLWAEAVVRYQSNEAWWVQTTEVAELCREQQEAREETDPWLDIASEWLRFPVVRRRTDDGIEDTESYDPSYGVTNADVLRGAVGISKDRIDSRLELRMAKVLTKLGWVRCQVRDRYDWHRRVWRYLPPANVTTSPGFGQNSPEGGDA